MKLALTCITILLLCSAAFSQNRQIQWSDDPHCGNKTNLEQGSERLNCVRISAQDGTVRIIKNGELTVAVRLSSDEGLLILQTVLVNGSEKPILFDSDRWEAAHFAPLAGQGDRFEVFKVDRSLPSRDLIRDLRTDVTDSILLEKFMSESLIERRVDSTPIVNNPRTQKLTPVPTSSRGTKTVQEANKADQERARDNGISRIALTSAKQIEIRKYSLTAKTIPANGNVRGLVYFKRNKKGHAAIFRLSLGETAYLFHIPYPNK